MDMPFEGVEPRRACHFVRLIDIPKYRYANPLAFSPADLTYLLREFEKEGFLGDCEAP